MKRCLVLFTFLLVVMVCGSPKPVSETEQQNAAWTTLYQDWREFPMWKQQELIRMYKLSERKYNWFPDSFPDYFEKRNLYHHKYNRIQK